MIKYILFLIIFLIGCQKDMTYTYTTMNSSAVSPKIIPVYIDQSLSMEDREAIKQANTHWNKVLNGYKTLEVEPIFYDPKNLEQVKVAMENGGYTIIRSSSKDNIPNETGYNETLAWADEIGVGHSIHLVRDRIIDNIIMNIIMHELGHLLGSPHLENGTLMQPKYNNKYYLCVDQKSARTVGLYQQIPLSEINYCYPN